MTPQSLDIPFGFCQCGCGQKTDITSRTITERHIYKGEPNRFITGHHQCTRGIHTLLDDAARFKLDGVYCRLIPLGSGQYTIVDEADYDWITKRQWYALPNSSKTGYYAGRKLTHGKHILLHREILGLAANDKRLGDHRNCCTLDNRRSNLKIASSFNNACNTQKPKHNQSGFKGVRTVKNRFVARIGFNGKQIHLGQYSTPEQAHKAYCAAADRYFGEFARYA